MSYRRVWGLPVTVSVKVIILINFSLQNLSYVTYILVFLLKYFLRTTFDNMIISNAWESVILIGSEMFVQILTRLHVSNDRNFWNTKSHLPENS